jgi:hypothetical protein
VGEVFRLGDFTLTEVENLNEIHGRPLQSRAEAGDLMRLVGGHPYLVRQSLYSIRTRLESLQALTYLPRSNPLKLLCPSELR